LFHSRITKSATISEPIAYDGLENFAKSQYEPNNINQAIGRESLFIYDFNFAPLNRKGRMSDRQKLKKEKLDLMLGRVPQFAIASSTRTLLKRLIKKVNPEHQKLILLSDQHYLYRRAVKSLGSLKQSIDHQTVSSKAPRTYKSILFPINHADLLSRQNIKAFARETISFSKTHAAMVQKYTLFMVAKNYLRPQFTKTHKRDPTANTQSPAQKLGLTQRILKYGEIFGDKIFRLHVSLSDDWSLFFESKTPYERRFFSLLPAHN
jgi:hypothetical protein